MPEKSGKLRKFSNCKKSQGYSGNFDFSFILSEVLRFKKYHENFFLDLEWDLVNEVSKLFNYINFNNFKAYSINFTLADSSLVVSLKDMKKKLSKVTGHSGRFFDSNSGNPVIASWNL